MKKPVFFLLFSFYFFVNAFAQKPIPTIAIQPIGGQV